jgi:hypothetical protein
VTDNQNTRSRYLPPGTPVRYDGLDEGGPEYDVIVQCWLDSEMDAHDVAFFGNRRPIGKPARKPYVLQYPSTSLTILDLTAPIESEF